MPGQTSWNSNSFSVQAEESRRQTEISEASIDAHFTNGYAKIIF